ncbi:hypothetical protein F4803DRAFT_110252 [Xylaria telfairii]|nr:hypothetical protein F4803DRAFT_110252 [Xylaria telfairii]
MYRMHERSPWSTLMCFTIWTFSLREEGTTGDGQGRGTATPSPTGKLCRRSRRGSAYSTSPSSHNQSFNISIGGGALATSRRECGRITKSAARKPWYWQDERHPSINGPSKYVIAVSVRLLTLHTDSFFAAEPHSRWIHFYLALPCSCFGLLCRVHSFVVPPVYRPRYPVEDGDRIREAGGCPKAHSSRFLEN